MTEPHDYRITVQRRETEDGLLFEGTVYEFPNVTVYGETFEEAYELATDAIEGLCELALEQGDAVPVPTERKTEFSGKFVVRVPKSLHRNLVYAAAEENISLNQYVISILSAHTRFASFEAYTTGLFPLVESHALAEPMDITWVTSTAPTNIQATERNFPAHSVAEMVTAGWTLDTPRNPDVGTNPLLPRRARA